MRGMGYTIGGALLALIAGCGGDGANDDASLTTEPFVPTTSQGGSTDAAPDDGGDDQEPGSDGDTTASASGSGDPTTTSSADTVGDPTGPGDSSGGAPGLDPPTGGSSGGSGGGAANGDVRMTPTGVTYRVIAPAGGGPVPAMIVYSGTEGGAQMTSNLTMLAGPTGNTNTVFAVLDGVTYNGDGGAGSDVLDDIRSQYDIDNDRTYLLSESAGTSAGLQLGLQLRQSYFAAYWANDVNTSNSPTLDAATLGFAPYGNAGPGGDFPDANSIVDAMDAAGYRTPEPSPYDGAGSGTHGSSDQFIASLEWFPGKTRQ